LQNFAAQLCGLKLVNLTTDKVPKPPVFTRESNHCFQRVLAIAILSVCLSVTRVDQSKTVQARITKSSPSAARNRKAFP